MYFQDLEQQSILYLAVDVDLTFEYTDGMKPGKIRAIAICIFLKEGKLLVQEGFDTVKMQTFGRPLGGRIEFGEYSQETVVREIREEIGAEVTDLYYWGTLENIFTYKGETGHEIVFIYRGDLVDRSLYELPHIDCIENGEPIRAAWIPLRDFSPEHIPLYPTGLLDLIRKKENL